MLKIILTTKSFIATVIVIQKASTVNLEYWLTSGQFGSCWCIFFWCAKYCKLLQSRPTYIGEDNTSQVWFEMRFINFIIILSVPKFYNSITCIFLSILHFMLFNKLFLKYVFLKLAPVILFSTFLIPQDTHLHE